MYFTQIKIYKLDFSFGLRSPPDPYFQDPLILSFQRTMNGHDSSMLVKKKRIVVAGAIGAELLSGRGFGKV